MTANRIISHVFLQPNLQQVSEAAMEKLVADHPYFSAARLFLAKKIYHTTGDLRLPAIKKALLYTSQPYYYYQFITSEGVLQEVEHPIAAMVPAGEDVVTVPAFPANDHSVVTSQETVMHPETLVAEAEEPVLLMPPAPDPPPDTGASEEIVIHALPEAVVPESNEPIKIFPLALPTSAETELVFQPLYTDDYFAYQRLKSPEDAHELNDQGMADMKSFTSWLRQIKDNFTGKTNNNWYHQQLHHIYEEEEAPEISETVEKMAMGSITFNNDIVSETLAEVWVRQHQYKNAIKIYQKLSLLNPGKNAYFAQKILDLTSQIDNK